MCLAACRRPTKRSLPGIALYTITVISLAMTDFHVARQAPGYARVLANMKQALRDGTILTDDPATAAGKYQLSEVFRSLIPSGRAFLVDQRLSLFANETSGTH